MTHIGSTSNAHESQTGNVLFLILIAVALFAALSYAVTQSSRGGGNADDETTLIDSATLVQYPTSLQNSALRMAVSDGVSNLALEFNIPSDFGTCTSSGANCIFHPSGGSATYQQGDASWVTGASAVDWVINSNNDVEGIGSDGGTSATAETIGFLPGVTDGLCRKINDQLGIGNTIAQETAGIDVSTEQTNGYSFSTSGQAIDGDLSGNNLVGQPSGCFVMGGVNYYYHTISEN